MEFTEFLGTVLPVLLVIFVVVFTLILLLRVILLFLIHQSYKKYLALKRAGQKIIPSQRKKFEKEEEERLRKKHDIPKAHSQLKAEIRAKMAIQESGSYEIIESQDQKLAKEELNESQIVDIVKPIGFWTSMILGQKLTYLVQSAQMLNKRGDKGFWASMIEAKERAAGRQHGRSR
ncbi:MAG: hypothetical protein ISQ34_04955 [Rickettsiales bacterium]|nr:hypothetical protein [Rickettsiales bacterium]